MKKIISLTLCVLMIMSMCVCVSAVNFSDLASDHWAHENIQKLVTEGTINGYSDGTFKPNKSVTRAEFVKMIGKWDQKYAGTYPDLSENHWAYEYIMWSGLDAIDNKIYPDVPILRSDVINLIWKRNGSPKNSLAPGAISSQGTNKDATSWAYTIGLMKGDDGLNLRLNSSLTRAEAATLIIRSRELVQKNAKNNFIDVVDENVLKNTFESLDLLEGKPYDADKVLTYGEVARMTIVFGFDGSDIRFIGTDLLNSKEEEFKELGHEYDNEMFILSANVWGDDYYTKAKIDAPITKQDAISAMMYGFAKRGTLPITVGEKNNYYPDCKDANSTSWENLYLTFANKNGIKLKAGSNLGAQENITIKEYSAFLTQLNEIVGLGIAYTSEGKVNAKVNTAVATMPESFKDFKHTIDGAPLEVYQAKKIHISAESSYRVVNLLSVAYQGYLSEVAGLTKSRTGVQIHYTYYPALSFKQDGKVIFTGKFVINETEDNTAVSVDTLLADVIKKPTGLTATKDNEIYVVFETYGPLMDIYLPYNEAYAKAVYVK